MQWAVPCLLIPIWAILPKTEATGGRRKADRRSRRGRGRGKIDGFAK